MRYDNHVAEHGRQRAAGRKPAGRQCRPSASEAAAGGTFIGAWVGPCCNGNDWITPMDPGGDAHWFDKIYGRLTTFEVLDPAKQAADSTPTPASTASSPATSPSRGRSPSDKLTWTFNLRKGVTWHDGEPFTAKDVKFTIELCYNPKNTMRPCHYVAAVDGVVGVKEYKDGTATEITGIKVVDDNTITFTFTGAERAVPDRISELFILPKHALGKIPPEQMKEATTGRPARSGPVRSSGPSTRPVSRPSSSAFDNYWRGKPKLDRIIRRALPGSGRSARSRSTPARSTSPTSRPTRSSASARTRTPSCCPATRAWTTASGLNRRDSPRVREHRVPPGAAHGDRSPVHRGQHLRRGREHRPVPVRPAEPDRAASAATRTIRPRPRRSSRRPASTSPTCGELAFDTYYADPLSANVMTAIAENWKTNLGLTVKPTAARERRLAEATTTRTATATSRSGAPPTARRATAASTTSTRRPRIPAGATASKGHTYINPELDKLLEDARAEFDQAKQDAIYQQVCQITHDDLPNIYLWQSVRFHVVSKKAQNVIVIPAAGGGSYYDAAELWTVTE